MKMHWTEKKCNKFKNPTGNQGATNNFILHYQRMQLKILKNYEASLMGVGDSSGDKSGSSDGENNNVDWRCYNEGEGDAEEEVDLVVPALSAVGDTEFNEENTEVEGAGRNEDLGKTN
jgi:hypothetical protein